MVGLTRITLAIPPTLLCLIVGGFELAGGVDIFLNFSKVGGGGS